MIEPSKFRNMMVSLFESKCKQWTNDTIEVWYNELSEYEPDELGAAFKSLIRSSESFPNIGQIIELIEHGAGEDYNQQAEIEWGNVLSSAKGGGNLPISARAAKALNSLGGMSWLRDADPDNTNWQRKEFIEIYNNITIQHNTDFRCLGLVAKILPDNVDDTILIENK